MAPRLWEVVGGADKGGLLVREGRALASPEVPVRLTTGSVVEEVQIEGQRLHYELRDGAGPQRGWVTLKLPGKELLRPKDQRLEPAGNFLEAKFGSEAPDECPAVTPTRRVEIATFALG